MKNLMKTVFAIILLCACSPSFGQTPESDPLTYKAYLEGKDVAQSKILWKEAVTKREEEFAANPANANMRYRLALAQFGLLTATMRDQDEDLFDEYVDEAEEHLEILMKGQQFRAEASALLGSLYGLQMAYSPWKGMYLGSKSGNLLEKALKQNPSSPLVRKLYANSKFYTPETFGGDVDEAIEAYKKSIQLYESNKAATKSNWFYLDAMAFLGQAYMKKGDHAKAGQIYENALQIEPEYNWVKFALLPEAKNSIE